MVNRRGHGHTSLISAMAPTGVFVLYTKKEDAIRAIEAVDGTVCDGRVLRYLCFLFVSVFLNNEFHSKGNAWNNQILHIFPQEYRVPESQLSVPS
jgi:hypothetical protein